MGASGSFRQYGENVAKRPVVKEVQLPGHRGLESGRVRQRLLWPWPRVWWSSGWSSGKGHREAILKPAFRNIGVGVVVAERVLGPHRERGIPSCTRR